MKKDAENKLDFSGQNIYVGLDVHLKSWAVTVLSTTLTLKKFSQDPDPEALHKFLIRSYPGATFNSVYEAGFSGFWIHEELTRLGINNIVVNPADVPTMVKEKLRKTDAVDSGKLARALRSGELMGIYIPEREALERRSLIRLRGSIVKDLTRGKNRIKAMLRFYGVKFPEQFERPNTHWSKRFMVWLRSIELLTDSGKQALELYIKEAENQRALLLQMTRVLRNLSRTDIFDSKMKLITSVPGIGITIGMSLLAEIDDIARFKNADQLAAYIGLIPMCHSSGEREYNGDITIRKHKTLRYQIVEAAWKSIGHDPAMTMAYETYRKRMAANRAIIKIARKLVNRIFFVLKHQQIYVPGVVR
jgi:transposase